MLENVINWSIRNRFLVIALTAVAITLVITYWAAKRTKTASEFYAADRSISGFQNGLALSGDYMSAASFLGMAAIMYGSGYHGLAYVVGWTGGYVLLALLLTVTNVTASGHASSHNATGSELCSLCIHAAGSDTALAPDSIVLPVTPPPERPGQPYASPCVLSITLCTKSSRAPPAIN